MLTNNNTIIITTTKPNNSTSNKRIHNLINKFSQFNIPIIINDYIVKNSSIHEISYEMIVNCINIFTRTNYDYAIICDNDFSPISNFLEELNTTVHLLPAHWRCLHLCPGYLWGRKFRDTTKHGHLNAEHNMDAIPFHASGRFYINCNPHTYFSKEFWLGGPIAFLLNKNTVASLLDDFIAQYSINNVNNDVILTQILHNADYICREPLLGYEDEQGGTTFTIT